jgi:hypothetical protein
MQNGQFRGDPAGNGVWHRLPMFTLWACFCGGAVAAEPVRNVGRDFDLQGFIDAALAAGERTVRVPPGRYRVTPRRAQHLVLRGLTDVVIDCTGVEMICTQTTRGRPEREV